MSDEEWSNGFMRCLGVLLNGEVMDEWDERGQHLHDDVLLLLINAHHESIPFTMPGMAGDRPWELLLDTAITGQTELLPYLPSTAYPLQGRSLVLLRQRAAYINGEDQGALLP